MTLAPSGVGGDVSLPNNNSSSNQSSKYSSSGYVGSDLWENDFLGLNQVHVNYGCTSQRSPRSSSGLGSSTHSGSSTASSNGTVHKSVFFSPARNIGAPNLHHTLMVPSSSNAMTGTGSNSVHNSPGKFYHHPIYLNKFMSSPQQQHPLVVTNGTSIRSPKGQKRSNVYV